MIAVSVSITVALSIGITLGLLCGIKYMQKKTTSKHSIYIPEENVVRDMMGPVYDEVKLEDKIASIDLSPNIAYEKVKETVY